MTRIVEHRQDAAGVEVTLPRILHRQYPQRTHAPSLCAGSGSTGAGGVTAKLRLAALRHLFDWLVIGQILPANPAAAVRGPRHIVRRGKTSVLDPAEARQLLDAIDTTTIIGLRDRALIGLMVYSFERISAWSHWTISRLSSP
jgi:site-specific recombinase XerC